MFLESGIQDRKVVAFLHSHTTAETEKRDIWIAPYPCRARIRDFKYTVYSLNNQGAGLWACLAMRRYGEILSTLQYPTSDLQPVKVFYEPCDRVLWFDQFSTFYYQNDVYIRGEYQGDRWMDLQVGDAIGITSTSTTDISIRGILDIEVAQG